MIYRNGKPYQNPADLVDFTASREGRAVWSWFPKWRRDALLDSCFESVQRLHTPPAGQPFIDASGNPYSDQAQFAEDLVIEFRERVYKLLKLRSATYELQGHGGIPPMPAHELE